MRFWNFVISMCALLLLFEEKYDVSGYTYCIIQFRFLSVLFKNNQSDNTTILLYNHFIHHKKYVNYRTHCDEAEIRKLGHNFFGSGLLKLPLF